MNRTRAVILIAFVVIILGLVAAFVLPGLLGGDDPDDTTDGTVGQVSEQQDDGEPAATITPTQEPIELATIVVAVQNLRRGQEIPPDAVDLRDWPVDSVPRNAITNLETIIGQRARTDIFVEQPILTSMVIPNLTDLASAGSDLAASIPDNFRAIAVPMDRLTSVAYGIQPGDRVDIIVSMLFVEIDEEFQAILPNNVDLVRIDEEGIDRIDDLDGRVETRTFPTATGGTVTFQAVISPSEEARPRLTTQMTVQDAQVMWVGDLPADGVIFGEPATPTPVVLDEAEQQQAQQAAATPTSISTRPDIVVLAISPQDAVAITYMIEARIPITFALRSATDTSQVPTNPVTLSYLLNEFNIVLPERLEYSIQPAIRSIRQLITGSITSFD